ncbi:arginase family protein [Frigidibacter oleivorans]|uniref:arginase family protein n=1 Tax=Frigidibacter oleivorans TaxID=2487129 RepID=UPI000F8C3C91|nr:arginase family protein [Frigidibacter oleivorans]
MAGRGPDLGRMFGARAGGGFMGLPQGDLDGFAGGVALIGAGACTSYASVGAYCMDGPAAIRAGGAAYAASLGHENFDLGGPVLPAGARVTDLGDLPQVDGEGEANRARIRDAVAAVLARGGVPVLLGGDDSVPLPMLEALTGREIWILQIDAHVDWRDAVEGERLGLSSTMRRASELPHVRGIVQVGQRGIGSARPGDRKDAEDWGVTFVPARAVVRDGIARALAAIPEGAEIAVCLDCDALDPAIMPAVIGRTAGGLGYWDVVDLVAGAAARGRIVAFDMVEFMPARDIDGQGALTAAQLLATVLGIVARQGQA